MQQFPYRIFKPHRTVVIKGMTSTEGGIYQGAVGCRLKLKVAMLLTADDLEYVPFAEAAKAARYNTIESKSASKLTMSNMPMELLHKLSHNTLGETVVFAAVPSGNVFISTDREGQSIMEWVVEGWMDKEAVGKICCMVGKNNAALLAIKPAIAK